MAGVIQATVSLSENSAHVRYASGSTTPQQIEEAIYALGFDVNVLSVHNDKGGELEPDRS